MLIRQLTREDEGAYALLRREALEREPFAFGASPGQDGAVFVECALGVNQAIFGAFGPDLVGMVGIRQERGLKARHRAGVWGMYVRESARRLGAGRRLMEAAIDFARHIPGIAQIHLAVSEQAPAAAALYQSLGFRSWGIEPGALSVLGQMIAESHMVLRIDSVS